MTQVTFPCSSCGASLSYAPGTTTLHCPYCNQDTIIQVQQAAVEELNYNAYLAAAAQDNPSEETTVIACRSCGAETRLSNATADVCPFCGSTLVSTTSRRLIQPRSLLPFVITREQAHFSFQRWIKGLWFAPNTLKRFAHTETRWLQGVYLPYWTYDAETTTQYTGERGEHYWDTETYTTSENGRTVTRTRQVRRTRWYPASGVVSNDFDDVLVMASRSLEQKYASQLVPWDLKNLVPYQEEFLSGFRAETYQIGLEDGFGEATRSMDDAIRASIRRDIGGDEQRIHAVDTQYYDVTFKHILLPIWLCSYRYRAKVYRFMVNGRTGRVTGERPWSWAKIALLILVILAIIAAFIYYITSTQSEPPPATQYYPGLLLYLQALG